MFKALGVSTFTSLLNRYTVEPQYNHVSRDWQNDIVISGYRYKQIPGITILKKSDDNYHYIGVTVIKTNAMWIWPAGWQQGVSVCFIHTPNFKFCCSSCGRLVSNQSALHHAFVVFVISYARCDELIWVKTNQLQRLIRTGRTGHWLNHGKEHCLVRTPLCSYFCCGFFSLSHLQLPAWPSLYSKGKPEVFLA